MLNMTAVMCLLYIRGHFAFGWTLPQLSGWGHLGLTISYFQMKHDTSLLI